MKIYFAHSFGLKGTAKEKEIIDLLRPFGEVVNPFDGEDALEKKYGRGYYDKPERVFARDIVSGDLELLDDCNCVFAYIDRRQIGTVFEIAYALLKCGIPVYVVCDQPSPFFLYHDSVYWYPSLEDFVEKEIRSGDVELRSYLWQDLDIPFDRFDFVVSRDVMLYLSLFGVYLGRVASWSVSKVGGRVTLLWLGDGYQVKVCIYGTKFSTALVEVSFGSVWYRGFVERVWNHIGLSDELKTILGQIKQII